jgi:hypothetical protein
MTADNTGLAVLDQSGVFPSGCGGSWGWWGTGTRRLASQPVQVSLLLPSACGGLPFGWNVDLQLSSSVDFCVWLTWLFVLMSQLVESSFLLNSHKENGVELLKVFELT